MISIRLLSGDGSYFGDILSEIQDDQRFGLDVALYDQGLFDPNVKRVLVDMDASRKSMHLNHHHYVAEDFILGLDHAGNRSFLADIEFASRVNVTNAVLHWNKKGFGPMPSKNRMAEILSVFEQKDILPHIENLVTGLDWQRQLIDVAEQSTVPFGVCFDIGHAKIWGSEPLDAWLAWLDELHSRSIPLIFHLHGNRGFCDDHFPLWMDDAVCEATSALNGFTPDGIIPVIRTFPSRFSGATFVLETSAKFAVENIRWARENMLVA